MLVLSRRSLLLAAATAPLARPLAAAPLRLRKAIMYSTIGVKGSVLEKFRAMKAAGFEGIEPMGAMDRHEVLAAFKETGLQAASVCDHIHWVKPLSAPDEATRQLGLDGLPRRPLLDLLEAGALPIIGLVRSRRAHPRPAPL